MGLTQRTPERTRARGRSFVFLGRRNRGTGPNLAGLRTRLGPEPPVPCEAHLVKAPALDQEPG